MSRPVTQRKRLGVRKTYANQTNAVKTRAEKNNLKQHKVSTDQVRMYRYVSTQYKFIML